MEAKARIGQLPRRCVTRGYARPSSYRVGVVSKLPLLNDTRHVPEQNVCMGEMEMAMARFKRAADFSNAISPEEEEALQARSLQRIVMQTRCTAQ